ncbi:hypothetical protein [Microvirga mediterraneensis]|uniref:Uncharacterized protein n=1 Tax=Microvirga mediterraneensis TaxID=2754695 RepID=A0A838BVR5_9HYPH|nr:hypothetical protein [Microvirga mediterraneensis]MBA1159360.1 hypothetical protein [Microvirga mediterraneensis]
MSDLNEVLKRVETAEKRECFIAIVGGEVRAAVAVGCHEKELVEWAADPRVEQIIRVPVEVPRQLLFEKWPGLDAAKALIAKGSPHG